MHLLDQRILGVAVVFLLGALVVVKRVATGSILDRPEGTLLVQVVNIFNLFCLLVLNPVAAALLIAGSLPSMDPTHVSLAPPWIGMAAEVAGLVLYVSGFLLMAWALATLGRNYQLGGSVPRSGDQIVVSGPYGMIRHPMYTAALGISLGLAFLIQSWALACVFLAYLVLILLLIPMEEEGLRSVYGEQYAAYKRKASALVPFIF